MKVTASQLASDGQAILGKVISKREAAEIERDGKTVAEIRPAVGVTREELLRKLAKIK